MSDFLKKLSNNIGNKENYSFSSFMVDIKPNEKLNYKEICNLNEQSTPSFSRDEYNIKREVDLSFTSNKKVQQEKESEICNINKILNKNIISDDEEEGVLSFGNITNTFSKTEFSNAGLDFSFNDDLDDNIGNKNNTVNQFNLPVINEKNFKNNLDKNCNDHNSKNNLSNINLNKSLLQKNSASKNPIQQAPIQKIDNFSLITQINTFIQNFNENFQKLIPEENLPSIFQLLQRINNTQLNLGENLLHDEYHKFIINMLPTINAKYDKEQVHNVLFYLLQFNNGIMKVFSNFTSEQIKFKVLEEQSKNSPSKSQNNSNNNVKNNFTINSNNNINSNISDIDNISNIVETNNNLSISKNQFIQTKRKFENESPTDLTISTSNAMLSSSSTFSFKKIKTSSVNNTVEQENFSMSADKSNSFNTNMKIKEIKLCLKKIDEEIDFNKLIGLVGLSKAITIRESILSKRELLLELFDDNIHTVFYKHINPNRSKKDGQGVIKTDYRVYKKVKERNK